MRLGLRLGLFQLSLGILGVLILGLLNRLLITEIGVSAALTALAIRGPAADGLQHGLGSVTARIEFLLGDCGEPLSS